ncbi:MAG: DUF2877 domain-containing protein [Nitrospinota bacterium]|jgi:hypothetical protein|nr:DUF2877 domain-containing protein [Nitrospinota bacterium]
MRTMAEIKSAEPGVTGSACVPESYIFPVTLMGGGVRRALGLVSSTTSAAGAAGIEGRVLAVFRRSFYLEMGGGSAGKEGALVCMGPAGIGPGPLNAICALPEGMDWRASGLAEGGRASCWRELLCAGRFSFSCAGAANWRPAPPGLDFDNAPAIRAALEAMARKAGRLAPEEGLGRLIPALARGEPARCEPDALDRRGGKDQVMRSGSRGAGALMRWIREMVRAELSLFETAPTGLSLSEPPEAAAGLIGLGPGLTPSGDDFIGGAMIALRTMGRGREADRLAAWALPLAESGTGRISRAHLECAARGEGAGALHRVMETIPGMSLRTGGDIAASLAAIDAVGHTSGWDALAGVVGAIAAVCGDFSQYDDREKNGVRDKEQEW